MRTHACMTFSGRATRLSLITAGPQNLHLAPFATFKTSCARSFWLLQRYISWSPECSCSHCTARRQRTSNCSPGFFWKRRSFFKGLALRLSAAPCYSSGTSGHIAVENSVSKIGPPPAKLNFSFFSWAQTPRTPQVQCWGQASPGSFFFLLAAVSFPTLNLGGAGG